MAKAIGKIVFTGGGSAGHVVPNLALMEYLRAHELYYIGTDGLEKNLIRPLKIPYGQIDCPKLIRKFTLKNLTIPCRLKRAVNDAEELLKKIEPKLVFSKGGFVALPVVFAARKLGIPCLTHESDLSLGLANRLMARKCDMVLTSFPETAKKVKNGCYVGSPLRKDLFKKNREESRKKYGFPDEKPVLLVLGGGSGSVALNGAVRENLFPLCEKFSVLHLCGKGNLRESNVKKYVQREFEPDMGAAYAAADYVMARAGSNTVFEVLSLKKPTLFVPLQKNSRGDQGKNAEYFFKKGLCHMTSEENLSEKLLPELQSLADDEELKKNITACEMTSGNERIISLIEEYIR